MTDSEKYLKQTESAVVKLFEGIDSYLKIPKVIIYMGDVEDNDAWQDWLNKNRFSLQSSLKSQKEFSAESFALAIMCGSLLQIAAMGIQLFSKNENISEELPDNVRSLIKPKSKPVKFCTGRLVSKLPIGLIIYAGRNQYNHMDAYALNDLNKIIFKHLAENYDNDTEEFFKDPAFDLENRLLTNFSSNITAILGWRNYELYYSDMKSLIVSV
ncbi:MAG: hypothetical protein ACK6CP_09110 [Pseudanabaena sp.]|jgi:hypothetical protein